MSSQEKFLNQMKRENITVKEARPRFPFQDPNQNVTAYEAVNKKYGVKMYVCFRSDGYLLDKKLEKID